MKKLIVAAIAMVVVGASYVAQRDQPVTFSEASPAAQDQALHLCALQAVRSGYEWTESDWSSCWDFWANTYSRER